MHRHETQQNKPVLQARAIPFSDRANHEQQHLSPLSSVPGTKV